MLIWKWKVLMHALQRIEYLQLLSITLLGLRRLSSQTWPHSGHKNALMKRVVTTQKIYFLSSLRSLKVEQREVHWCRG
jgi:hypothetical protein